MKQAGMDNYEAYKAGTRRKDSEIYFIVPDSYNTFWDNAEQWSKYAFRYSRFLGTKAECERNLSNYPDHKII